MKKIYVLGCLAVASSLMIGQTDEASLRDSMKKIAPTNGGLGKKIAAKDASAADDAKTLQGMYADLHKFFAEKKMDDAVGFSDTGAELYGKVGKLVAAGSWDEAATEQKKLGATCMGCHSAHRDKLPDGSYKMK